MVRDTSFHEVYRREAASKDDPSSRSFGFLFAALFAIMAAWTGWHGNRWCFAWLAAAGATGTIALIGPGLLAVPSYLWFRLAQLLARIINPLVMFVIYAVMLSQSVELYRQVPRRRKQGQLIARTSGPRRWGAISTLR